MSRPSMRLYLREDPRWRDLLGEGEYAWGYTMGELDARAGLVRLPKGDVPVGYGEGYADGFADWSHRG